MKQTAVEWLVSELMSKGIINLDGWVWDDNISIVEIMEQAKEMDKQAHKETWDVAHQAGRFEGKGIAEENWQTFEEYWDETFKQQEQ